MTAILRAQYDGAEHALTDIEEIYVGHPFTERVHHYGSRIVFDHDGYLYFSIGDRGEMETAQDYTTDRKSTRLNSSHVAISYAVFCLTKKTPITTHQLTNLLTS